VKQSGAQPEKREWALSEPISARIGIGFEASGWELAHFICAKWPGACPDYDCASTSCRVSAFNSKTSSMKHKLKQNAHCERELAAYLFAREVGGSDGRGATGFFNPHGE
jgi:hypothetical protein